MWIQEALIGPPAAGIELQGRDKWWTRRPLSLIWWPRPNLDRPAFGELVDRDDVDLDGDG
jgi:hypothetical protein